MSPPSRASRLPLYLKHAIHSLLLRRHADETRSPPVIGATRLCPMHANFGRDAAEATTVAASEHVIWTQSRLRIKLFGSRARLTGVWGNGVRRWQTTCGSLAWLREVLCSGAALVAPRNSG